MKTGRVISIIAFLLYVASFASFWGFLSAVKEASAAPTDTGVPGYLCAYITLQWPWTADGGRTLHQEPVKYFGMLLSGWINPVFLITFVLLLIKPSSRLGGVLRVLLLLMFVACWVVFYKQHLRPQAGYFLWTAAMLLALFAYKLFRPKAKPASVHLG